MVDIKNLNLKELKELLGKWGFSGFHSRQIFYWIYKKKVLDFSEMTDLPLELRQKLKENFYACSLKLVKRLLSKDKTEKFLLELEDKSYIEAVMIPAQKRFTGCVSTQVGCKFACRFCASGLLGFKRNLTSTEILDEVLILQKNSLAGQITHLVFMGIGEPLANYENLLRAIRIINSSDAFNIGARKITISTCGIIPGIKKLLEENLQIELSISLHSVDDKIRTLLMPVNKIYPLAELISACKEYIEKANRQITFEYILIKDVNSDLPSARKLTNILQDLKLCKVNLIVANPIRELNIESPSKLEVLLFRDYLLKAGINATLRKPRGQDIQAACGQLRLKYEK